MSNPPPIHPGDSGETSARLRPPGAPPELRNEAGEPVSIILQFAPGTPRETYFEAVV